MKDTKSIISALKKEDGVVVTPNVVIKYGRCGDVADNGRATIGCTLKNEVHTMVKITQQVIDDADAHATELEEAAAEAKKAAEAADATKEDKATAKQAEADAKVARDAADALELDEWTRGENNFIFLTTYQILAMLRDNPETVFLATYLDNILHDEDDDIRSVAAEYINELLVGATITHIAIDVEEGEDYVSPFSRGDGNLVDTDSVYHECAQLKLSELGWDVAEDIRETIREERRARLAKRGKRGSRTTRRHDVDDSED